MKVNINDIEDIIIAKIEIDKNNPNLNGRSPLNEFMNDYCKINWILMYNNVSIPFEIKTIYDNKYIFFSTNSEDEKNILFEFIDKIKENISKLKKVDNNTIYETGMKPDKVYIIMNNRYYTL